MKVHLTQSSQWVCYEPPKLCLVTCYTSIPLFLLNSKFTLWRMQDNECLVPWLSHLEYWEESKILIC